MPPCRSDDSLDQIWADFDHLSPGVALDRLAAVLARHTGRNELEVRRLLRNWAIKLFPVMGESERRTVNELLDIVVIGPSQQPTWSPLSAIDTLVERYAQSPQLAPAAKGV